MPRCHPPHSNRLHRPEVFFGPQAPFFRVDMLEALARPGQGHRRNGGKPLRWELEASWEILLTLGVVQRPWITPPIATPRSEPVEGVRASCEF